MYDTKMFGQVADYQKTLIDNAFTMMTVVQDQGLAMMDKAVEKNTLLPDSSIKMCTEWIHFIKQNRENFRAYLDGSLDKFNTFFSNAQTEKPPVKETAKKTK